MTNKEIDELYNYGIKHGSNGGKIIGAGGGGFILFQTDAPAKLKKKFEERNIKVVDFNFVPRGTEIINI